MRSPGALRAEPDGVAAPRRRAHGGRQPPLRRRARRRFRPAHRRHGRRAGRGRLRGGDPRELEWLGVGWDEGPFRQSERAERAPRGCAQAIGEPRRGGGAPVRRDHACVRADGRPTYHLASVVDDLDLRDQPRDPRQGSAPERAAPRGDRARARRRAAGVHPPRAAGRRGRPQALEARPGGVAGRPARARASRRRRSAPTSRSSDLPRGDVHFDERRLRRLAVEALGALDDEELAARVGAPPRLGPALRGAHDLVEARAIADELERAPAPADDELARDSRALPRAARGRGARSSTRTRRRRSCASSRPSAATCVRCAWRSPGPSAGRSSGRSSSRCRGTRPFGARKLRRLSSGCISRSVARNDSTAPAGSVHGRAGGWRRSGGGPARRPRSRPRPATRPRARAATAVCGRSATPKPSCDHLLRGVDVVQLHHALGLDAGAAEERVRELRVARRAVEEDELLAGDLVEADRSARRRSGAPGRRRGSSRSS